MKKAFQLIGIILCFGVCALAAIKEMHANRSLREKLNSTKAELRIYKDSVEVILNRGTRCDSFATPNWDAVTNVKRIAIRNWTAYHIYLKELALADSVRTQALKGTLYNHYFNQWLEEYEKDNLVKLKMAEQLIARNPELRKIQATVLASKLLDISLPDEQQEQLDRFSESNEVMEIALHEGQMTTYNQQEQDKAGSVANKQHQKEVTKAWEDFLAVNR
jgi:hypothetical protein